MKVSIVYDPDPALGNDPSSVYEVPLVRGAFIDNDKTDVIVMWREYGDQFEGGFRTHYVADGVWRNVTMQQVEDVLTRLGTVE